MPAMTYNSTMAFSLLQISMVLANHFEVRGVLSPNVLRFEREIPGIENMGFSLWGEMEE